MVKSIDKDEGLKEAAGIKRLTPYLNYYEIQTLCKLLNKTDDEVFELNDIYATKILIGNKESLNFENKLNELRSKK